MDENAIHLCSARCKGAIRYERMCTCLNNPPSERRRRGAIMQRTSTCRLSISVLKKRRVTSTAWMGLQHSEGDPHGRGQEQERQSIRQMSTTRRT